MTKAFFSVKEDKTELVDKQVNSFGITLGGYYSLQTGASRYQVVRIIATEECGVHFFMYAKWFDAPPTYINPEELQQSSAQYMPFRWWPLFAMAPQYLTEEPVCEEEISAYRLWQNKDGMYWGD